MGEYNVRVARESQDPIQIAKIATCFFLINKIHHGREQNRQGRREGNASFFTQKEAFQERSFSNSFCLTLSFDTIQPSLLVPVVLARL